MKRYVYAISISVMITLGVSQSVFAEDPITPELSMSPSVLDVRTDQGRETVHVIHVRNDSTVPLPIKSKITDFTAEEESGSTILGHASDDPLLSPRQWLVIDEASFILDPGETKKVRVTVNVPSDVALGGYYASVLFEPQLPAQYFEEGQMRAIPSLGALFLLAVGIDRADRPDVPLVISEFSIPQEFHLAKIEGALRSVFGLFKKAEADAQATFSVIAADGFPFTLLITNNDLFHIKPSGTLSILKRNGTVVSTIDIPSATILPQKTRIFPVDYQITPPQWVAKILPQFTHNYFAKLFFIGKHEARLTLGAEDYSIEESISFWFFPWKTLFFTILVICLIIFMSYRYKIGRRLIGAINALFSGTPQSQKSNKDIKKIEEKRNPLHIVSTHKNEHISSRKSKIAPSYDYEHGAMRVRSPQKSQNQKKKKKHIMKF